MKNNLPNSFFFFYMTLALFLLQAFPLTGFFLMFMAAAYWSAVLINIGMIGTIIEVVSGSRSKWYLLVPITFYVLGAGIFVQEIVARAILKSEMQTHNEQVVVSFDPNRQNLVFEDYSPALILVREFGLQSFFAGGFRGSDELRFFQLAPKQICEDLKNSSADQNSDLHILDKIFHVNSHEGSYETPKNYCLLSIPGHPEKPAIRVSSSNLTSNQQIGTLPVRQTQILIGTTEEKSFAVRAAEASVIYPVPLPYMGCFLNSAASGWECVSGFLRGDWKAVGHQLGSRKGNLLALAEALGLKKQTPTETTNSDIAKFMDLLPNNKP